MAFVFVTGFPLCIYEEHSARSLYYYGHSKAQALLRDTATGIRWG